VELGDVDLDLIFFEEQIRTVAEDNTVSLTGTRLQIAKQAGRRTCAGLHVQVRRHLDGGYAIRRGTQVLGRCKANGETQATDGPVETAAHKAQR
jgi:hypothetical protein